MGCVLARIFYPVSTNIVMVGLDTAGKSTILYQLKQGETVTTSPTPGFNVESVEYKNTYFTVWDIGGQDKIRVLWRHYYRNMQALILVVDSTDKDRIVEVNEELQKILHMEEIKDTTILVLANKQDLPNSMSISEITGKLNLHSLRSRKWHIQPTCAITGDGLLKGLDWLSTALRTTQNINST